MISNDFSLPFKLSYLNKVPLEVNKNVKENVHIEKPPVLLLDYDQTLVIPKEGRPFPKDVDDWQWLFPNVPSMIKKCHRLSTIYIGR